LRPDYELAHDLNSKVLNPFLLPSDIRVLCRTSGVASRSSAINFVTSFGTSPIPVERPS
jgi:hypothetical protein